jgi:hypothetical protein
MKITPTSPSPVEGGEKRGISSTFRIHFSPQGARATEGEREEVSEQRLNANDFSVILAQEDTEKLERDQEKYPGCAAIFQEILSCTGAARSFS